MRSRLGSYGSTLALASSVLWSPEAAGQSAAKVGVSVSASTSTADISADGSALRRYRPEAKTFELGAFAGALLISDQHSFRGRSIFANVEPGRNLYTEFEQPSLELGLRGAYFPMSYLGGEAEGLLALAEGDDDGATILGGRAHVIVQAPSWRVVPFALLGAGYWAILRESLDDDQDPALHFGGGVKVAATGDVSFRLDVRDNVTNRRGGGDYPHHLEVSAGASLVLGRARPPAPPDPDGDGILVANDRCPGEAGLPPEGCPAPENADADGDGLGAEKDQCPGEPGPAPTGCAPTDQDGDGVADGVDQCELQAGVAPLGCPDGDGDGVLDREDQCVDVAGVAPGGCPADGDGDGRSDAEDPCPAEAETQNGFEDEDGCPDELPPAPESFSGVIPGIEFELNQDAITTSSEEVLARAVQILLDHPALRVEIVGHSDDTGERAYNLVLSQRRAQAAKNHLVARGIQPERITTRGAGPDEPLAPEKTREARRKNRRIEFQIVK